MIRMRRFLVLAPLALAACSGRSSEPKAVEAWVRLPAVSGNPAAGYFTLHGGRGDKKLIKIESTLAERTEMHASMKGMQGMTTMKPIDHVDVPAGATVTFAPGGNHAMLFGLDPAIKPGTAVPLRFGFSDGSTAEAEAKTVGAGDAAPY